MSPSHSNFDQSRQSVEETDRRSQPGSPDRSFDDVMARLRAGNQEAATEIFNRFAYRLIALARSRLDSRTRAKLDPEDVIQSVYKSFFVRFAEGQFDLQTWDSLWSLLTVITLRKCGHHTEYFHAACRDVGREATPPPSREDSIASWQAIARDPTPSEAVILAETLEAVMHGLDERERQILALSLQGHTTQEISSQVGRTERTVRRALELIRKRLERMRDQDES